MSLETFKILVRHYKIRILDNGRLFIHPGKTFDTLKDLVVHYSNDADGLCVKLEQPCYKPPPRISDPLPNFRKGDEIPIESLKFVKTLGKGKFGKVFYGFWNDIVEVAIKSFDSSRVLLQEAAVLKAVSHPKIIRMYAICTTKEPFCMVMEYMCNGNLHDHLNSYLGKKLRLRSLVDISAQIADGMMYIEANRMIHGDLATRNILVGDRGTVKLSGFGLASIMNGDEFMVEGEKTNRRGSEPKIYTIKSDALAFGIVLYDIFTHGSSAYLGKHTAKVLEDMTKTGCQLPKPSDPECADAVYEIMTMCWNRVANDRPTFEFLYHFFADFPVTSEAPKEKRLVEYSLSSESLSSSN